jgi:hypothetical protein
MTGGAALRALAALLRPGAPLPSLDDAEWRAVLALANAHLLTPALAGRVRRAWRRLAVPEDVAVYLALLHERNGARNDTLRGQAAELTRALNARGVAPLLLKGAISLFEDPYGDPDARMIGDLDILVPAPAIDDAVDTLRELGYRASSLYGAGHNAYGEFARPGSPAPIDLHLAPIDSPHLLDAAALWNDAVALTTEPLVAGAPSPTHRVLHALLHAQIHHDGGYYRGELRLNQLYEVVMLARHHGGAIDWRRIAACYAAHRLEPALHSYLLAAGELFGLAWPLAGRPSLAARLHRRRATLQLAWPQLSRVTLPWGNLRRAFAWHRMRALYGDRHGRLTWRWRHLRQFIAKQGVQHGVARVFRAP